MDKTGGQVQRRMKMTGGQIRRKVELDMTEGQRSRSEKR
jgi:hypothetical protein